MNTQSTSQNKLLLLKNPIVFAAIITILGNLLIAFIQLKSTNPPDDIAPKSETHIIFDDVKRVLPKFNTVIRQEFESKGHIIIENLALDMGVTIPSWFYPDIIKNKQIENVEYKAIVIDWKSPYIKELVDGEGQTLTSGAAQKAIERTRGFVHLPSVKARNIQFEIRGYKIPPTIHGFLINGRHLFIGYTEMNKKKLDGGWFPYQYFRYDSDAPLTKHFFRMYKSWFQYYWEHGDSFVTTWSDKVASNHIEKKSSQTHS